MRITASYGMEQLGLLRSPLMMVGMDSAHVRDLWTKTDKGRVNKEIEEEIPPHGAILLRLSSPKQASL